MSAGNAFLSELGRTPAGIEIGLLRLSRFATLDMVYSNNFLNTTFYSPAWTLAGRQAILRAIASKIMVTFHHMMDLHHIVTFHQFENKMVQYRHIMDLHHS